MKLDFFPIKKVFRRFSKIGYFFFHLKFISIKKIKKSENIFREKGREVGREGGNSLQESSKFLTATTSVQVSYLGRLGVGSPRQDRAGSDTNQWH